MKQSKVLAKFLHLILRHKILKILFILKLQLKLFNTEEKLQICQYSVAHKGFIAASTHLLKTLRVSDSPNGRV